MKVELLWALGLPGAILGLIAFKYLIWWIWDLSSRVGCWFCGKRTYVRNSRLNSWFCPSCEQYNGFTRDGGYNRRFPQLFEEKLNRCSTLIGRCKNGWKSNRSLCRDCNRLQELKITQLAEFIPLNPKNYDQEIEHFKEHMEKVYTLCSKCEHLLREVFEGERAKFRMPKRLGAAFKKVGDVGGKSMFTIVVLSLAVCLLALHRLKLIPPFIHWDVVEKASPLVGVIRQEIDRAPRLVDYTVLATGILANCLGFYQTRSWVVGLNSFNWIATFALHVFFNDQRISLVNRIQAIFGIVSMLLSVLVLLQVKLKAHKKPRQLHYYSSFRDLDNGNTTQPQSKPEDILRKTPKRPATVIGEDHSSANLPDDSYNLRKLQSLRLGSPCRSRTAKRTVLSSDESSNWWDGLDSSSAASFGRRTPWSNSLVSPPKFTPKPNVTPRAFTVYNFERNSESPPDLDNISSWSAPVLTPNVNSSWYRSRPPTPPPHHQSQYCCCATLTRCHNATCCDPSVFRASSTPIPSPVKETIESPQFNLMTFLQGAYHLSVVGLLGFNVFLFYVVQTSKH